MTESNMERIISDPKRKPVAIGGKPHVWGYKTVRELAGENKILKEEKSKDRLTKALNREATEDYINKLIEGKKEFSLIFTDGDHFKSVNDSYGHDAGDKVLQVTIQRIKSKISEHKGDAVGRWGGDEIVIILNGINDETFAKERAEEIRASFSDKPIVLEDEAKTINHTLSFGIAVHREGQNLETLTKIADNNCYIAKRLGGNMVVTEGEAVKYFI